MKVVQILPELDAGGVERGTLELASHLQREGHQAIVISNGGRLVGQLELSGARHVTMPVHRKSAATLLQVQPLRRFLGEERPDILHIRSRVPGWVAWLAWRGMHPEQRPRLVSTVHGFYSVNPYSAVMTKGERVIAVSHSIRDYVLRHYPRTPEEIIRVVPRGIDPSAYYRDFTPSAEWWARWRAEHPSLDGKRVLLLPGRITRLKGHPDYFRLIQTLKAEGQPVHGLVAGDATSAKRAYAEELRSLAEALGIARDVTFLGHRSDIREVMAASDMVFALSQQPESFGRTVLEAFALGKPVVGYDCGGVGELLAAFFPMGKVPPGDRTKLLAATRAVLAGHPLPQSVEEPYTVDAMCRATLAVYQELRRGGTH